MRCPAPSAALPPHLCVLPLLPPRSFQRRRPAGGLERHHRRRRHAARCACSCCTSAAAQRPLPAAARAPPRAAARLQAAPPAKPALPCPSTRPPCSLHGPAGRRLHHRPRYFRRARRAFLSGARCCRRVRRAGGPAARGRLLVAPSRLPSLPASLSPPSYRPPRVPCAPRPSPAERRLRQPPVQAARRHDAAHAAGRAGRDSHGERDVGEQRVRAQHQRHPAGECRPCRLAECSLAEAAASRAALPGRLAALWGRSSSTSGAPAPAPRPPPTPSNASHRPRQVLDFVRAADRRKVQVIVCLVPKVGRVCERERLASARESGEPSAGTAAASACQTRPAASSLPALGIHPSLRPCAARRACPRGLI